MGKWSVDQIRAARLATGVDEQAATEDAPAADVGEAAPPSPDAMRAKRLQATLQAQADAAASLGKADALTKGYERMVPAHGQIPAWREDIENLRPYTPLSGGLSPAVAAAAARERARAGDLTSAVTGKRTATGLVSQTGPGSELADPRTNIVASGLQYPLRGLAALLRPLDFFPAVAKKAVEQGHYVPHSWDELSQRITAGVANADPLGRFTGEGARRPRWSVEPTTWHDVADELVKKYQWDPVIHLDPAHGLGQAFGQDLHLARPAAAAAGTVADIGLSPSTYLTAGTGAMGRRVVKIGEQVIADIPVSKGIQLAGQTVLPDAAVRAMARFPGSALEKLPGAAGRALGQVGAAQAVEAVPRVIGSLPLGGGNTVGDLLGQAFNRYHRIDQIADPALRGAVRELAQLRESATAAQTTHLVDQVEKLLKDVPLEQQRVVRDIIENPAGFDFNVAPARAPFRPEPSSSLPVPMRATPEDLADHLGLTGDARAEYLRSRIEREVSGTATTSGTPYRGQTAAPTAVPGTPDAARYGAIPEHLSGQIPFVTPEQGELAARIENVLRDTRARLERQGLIRGREDYFPRERTPESLIQERGTSARAEKLGGRGVDPRLDFRSGFQNRREEHGWINDLIDRVNRQEQSSAAAVGKAFTPIPNVEDTTSAVNRFWASLPERLQEATRGRLVSEPERFLDDPRIALQRYLARAVRSSNDLDTLQKIGAMKVEGQPVARPFMRESKAGRVYESNPSPDYTFWRPSEGPPPIPIDRERRIPSTSSAAAGEGPSDLARQMYPELYKDVPGKSVGELPGGVERRSVGKSPIDPMLMDREIPGYVYPKNAAWREAFPEKALPKDIAAYIDAFGKPYWQNNIFERLLIQPLHKVQLPWKVAATSGAGFRFAIRNYESQQIMNLQAYGARVFAPKWQLESHILGLPDEVLSAYPKLANRTVEVGGKVYTASELRDVAKQTGLWRTMPEAEQWSHAAGPFGSLLDQPAHATRAMGWKDPKAALSAALGKGEAAGSAALRTIAPGNPFSKDFVLTKGLAVGPGGARVGFHPLAEYGERQGRMLALLMELEDGKSVVQAGQDAAKTHVNYRTFSATFEKYGTLAYPFAKFGAAMIPNQVRWSLQYPGRSMFTEHLLRGGEHMVPPEERERYAQEPKASLIAQNAGRLVGYPGVGALKEPEAGRAKGAGRLPYVFMPPTADVYLNTLGAPARILSAREPLKQLGSEVLEGALPVFKAPYELATGRNVFTGEPMKLGAPQPAPRAVQALEKWNPDSAAAQWLRERVLAATGAQNVVDPRSGTRYLATPMSTNLLARYYPNVATADIVAGLAGGERPYDNRTALALRLLGQAHYLHDPLIPASQEAHDTDRAARELRDLILQWLPDTTATKTASRPSR